MATAKYCFQQHKQRICTERKQMTTKQILTCMTNYQAAGITNGKVIKMYPQLSLTRPLLVTI